MFNYAFSYYKLSILIVLAFMLTGVDFIQPNRMVLSLPEPELNPLEIPIDDPLLPSVPRPLTPFEQKRLRRILGRIEEVKALGRVGKFAWDNTRTEDVQIISKRLVTLQQLSEEEDPLSPEFLIALANAYAKLHSLDNSITIYQKVLNYARKNTEPFTVKEALQGLGRLYLAKFDYPRAAVVYEELLDQAQLQQNTYEEGLYLQALAEIYTASLQPNNSADIKQRLVDSYLTSQKIEFIPPLKIDIGKDYEALDKPELASQNYQEAYALAWSLQLFGAASEALTKLANLYTNYDQEDYALEIYQRLIQVEQLSYNYYGLMKAYDKIGEIYLKQKQYDPALSAFQEGLILARSLNHDQAHFLAQIQKVNRRRQKDSIPNFERDLTPTPNNIDSIPGNLEEFEESVNETNNL